MPSAAARQAKQHPVGIVAPVIVGPNAAAEPACVFVESLEGRHFEVNWAVQPGRGSDRTSRTLPSRSTLDGEHPASTIKARTHRFARMVAA
jgi:hypothetical protein